MLALNQRLAAEYVKKLESEPGRGSTLAFTAQQKRARSPSSMHIPSQHRADKTPSELFLAGIRDEEPPWQRFFARPLGIDHP
jgi:hypothetical protein